MYNFLIFFIEIIFFFFETVQILLTIVIKHYIFLVYFGKIKIFKYQNYYSNFHPLKEIILIIKTYHIITINITQIIDSTINSNLYFPILK